MEVEKFCKGIKKEGEKLCTEDKKLTDTREGLREIVKTLNESMIEFIKIRFVSTKDPDETTEILKIYYSGTVEMYTRFRNGNKDKKGTFFIQDLSKKKLKEVSEIMEKGEVDSYGHIIKAEEITTP